MSVGGSKFKMKVKLQGFELEIEGSREDAAIIGKNVGEQLSAMLAPSVNIVEGTSSSDDVGAPLLVGTSAAVSRKKQTKRPKSSAKPLEQSSIEFRHDSDQFGMPNQEWNTAKKSMWLLYVVSKSTSTRELSAGQIAQLFNSHFKQAGMIKTHNVSRDLGKAKIANPSPIGEDVSKTPPLWFLKDEGNRQMQTVIAEARSAT